MPTFWLILFILLLGIFTGIYFYLAMRHRERVNLLSVASWVALGIAFFIVTHVIGLMLYPIKIQDVAQPIEVINPNKQVKAGDYLILKVKVNKYISSPSTLYPVIICNNGDYYTYPSRVSNVPPGYGEYIIANSFLIPKEAKPTTCHTRTTDVFKLNILREKTYIFESEPFAITE